MNIPRTSFESARENNPNKTCLWNPRIVKQERLSVAVQRLSHMTWAVSTGAGRRAHSNARMFANFHSILNSNSKIECPFSTSFHLFLKKRPILITASFFFWTFKIRTIPNKLRPFLLFKIRKIRLVLLSFFFLLPVLEKRFSLKTFRFLKCQ